MENNSSPTHGLSCEAVEPNRPGVVLIQIDGLRQDVFRREVEKNRLPFFRRLLDAEGYRAGVFYSGIPSTTPAVQAELLFGVRGAVPAFRFVRRDSEKVFLMWDAVSATLIARDLRDRGGPPLLEGGTSYSNIFIGGAKEAYFCAETLYARRLQRYGQFWKNSRLLLQNREDLARIVVPSLAELGPAFADFVKGIREGWDPIKEFKFVFGRSAVVVGLREWIGSRVRFDIGRGIPIIHANFNGYDEQSHRRGPLSPLSARALQGIESTVERIYQAAQSSPCRPYRLIVYSDHGQEDSLSYEKLYGKSFNQAVAEVFSQGPLSRFGIEKIDQQTRFSNLYQRARTASKRTKSRERTPPVQADEIRVTSMGPFGHIYIPEPIPADEMFSYAHRLVNEARIPLVLFLRDDRWIGVNGRGQFDLRDERGQILGAGHPLLDRVTEDLEAICRHPDSGDFVVSGWDPEGCPLTLSVENGSHGGPGKDETRGFILSPSDLELPSPVSRAEDLRQCVLKILNRKG